MVVKLKIKKKMLNVDRIFKNIFFNFTCNFLNRITNYCLYPRISGEMERTLEKRGKKVRLLRFLRMSALKRDGSKAQNKEMFECWPNLQEYLCNFICTFLNRILLVSLWRRLKTHHIFTKTQCILIKLKKYHKH